MDAEIWVVAVGEVECERGFEFMRKGRKMGNRGYWVLMGKIGGEW